MKRLPGLVLVVVLVAAAVPSPAAATNRHKADVIKVMTRNQYLGADLAPVTAAETWPDFVAAATEALGPGDQYPPRDPAA